MGDNMKKYILHCFYYGDIRHYYLLELGKKLSNNMYQIAQVISKDKEEIEFITVENVIKWKFKQEFYGSYDFWYDSSILYSKKRGDMIIEFEDDESAELWFRLNYGG
jgi:hypothetical protein